MCMKLGRGPPRRGRLPEEVGVADDEPLCTGEEAGELSHELESS